MLTYAIWTLSFFFFDPRLFDGRYWLLVLIPTLLLGLIAQWRMKAAYAKASKIRANSGLTGAQAAAEILQANGIQDVKIEQTQGFLSDHYDPRTNTLRLSPAVYRGQSLAALGIAAHEVGHAIQKAENYGPLVIRNGLVPIAGIGSGLSYFIIFLGLILNMTGLAWAGVILFGVVVLFQLVNLPVEFDASARAKRRLFELGMVTESERGTVSGVLGAAAMTYVAATIGALLHLLYYVMLVMGSARD